MLHAETDNCDISFIIPRSRTSTTSNKTGTWRFARPVFENKTAPCSIACPAGEDIARIETLVLRREYQAAWETIVMENPFPAVCGRVCFHPCERVCNRAGLDEALAVHQVERFVGDWARQQGLAHKRTDVPARCHRVAVIGAGPAGLAAAFFMARLGWQCDVLESAAEPGGLLRWGIPAYRLPPAILAAEIAAIEQMGVTITCNTHVDRTRLAQLRNSFDAVFASTGLTQSLDLRIPGAELARDGLTFLAGIRRQVQPVLSGTAAVVGGGNTAVDVARSLKRLGAQPVIVYRRRREDMPAFKAEVELALAEDIPIHTLQAPLALERNGDNLVLHLQPMRAQPQSSGRALVTPANAPRERLDVTHVFAAIGAEADALWRPPDVSSGQVLSFSRCRLVTQPQPVVYGGDLTNNVQSVTDAIASGKQAALLLDVLFERGLDAIPAALEACRLGDGSAQSMDLYLKGARALRSPRKVTFEDINTDYFTNQARLTPERRTGIPASEAFAELEKTFSEAMTLQEAGRCFSCGLCNDCDNCSVYCPEIAVQTGSSRRIDLDYCKGCGICVVECPRHALSLEEETL